MEASSTKHSLPPPQFSGNWITRGRDRGTCTTACRLSRPNASRPSSVTIKAKFLFAGSGNGCAGSSPTVEMTGATSRRKKRLSQLSCASLHWLDRNNRMFCDSSCGSTSSFSVQPTTRDLLLPRSALTAPPEKGYLPVVAQRHEGLLFETSNTNLKNSSKRPLVIDK